MADEEQPQQELPPQSPVAEPTDSADQESEAVVAADAAEATLEDAQAPAAEAASEPDQEAATDDIDVIPPSDPDHLTAVVRGEDTAAAARTAAIFDEDDDDEEAADEGDLPSFRKREARDASNADDPDAAIIRKKKKKRHHSPDEPSSARHALDEGEVDQEEEDPYANMTEAEIRRARTDRMIDEALRAGKKKAPRKRAGEDDLDLLADEEVAALRREMVTAADDDEEANRLKKPATNKLKLLPKVVATLQKYVSRSTWPSTLPKDTILTVFFAFLWLYSPQTETTSSSRSWTTTCSKASSVGSSLCPTNLYRRSTSSTNSSRSSSA